MALNGFFKTGDDKITQLADYALPVQWWSRPYEYAWAIRFAREWHEVADMGCGWMYRPLKNALARRCKKVYAVDADNRLMKQEKPDNVEFVVTNFAEKRVEQIKPSSLDSVFCISVLEELNDMVKPALKEFRRLLKDNGHIYLTFDVPFDKDKPTPTYPGLSLQAFEDALFDAELSYMGAVSYNKNGAVIHKGWNLCVFHCILEKV